MKSPAYFECEMPKTVLILTPAYVTQTVAGNEYIPRNQNELFLSRCGNPHANTRKWEGSETLLIPRNTDVTSALLPCKTDTIKMTTRSKAGRIFADLQPNGQTK
jgi:hypothetical protein